MADASLPDLSVPTGKGRGEKGKDWAEGELEEVITDALGGIEISEEEVGNIIAKAGEYEEKLEKGKREGQKERGKGKDIFPPEVPAEQFEGKTVRERTRERLEKEKEEKEKEQGGKKKGKGKGKASKQAGLARRLMAPATTDLPVKPLSLPKEGENKQEATGGEGAVSEEKKKALTPPDLLSEPPPADGTKYVEDGKEERDEEMTPTMSATRAASPPLDPDEAAWTLEEDHDSGSFPSVQIPGKIGEYKDLSMASSQWEGVSEDINALSRQMESVLTHVRTLATSVARIEERVGELERDRTQFASATLDRVRGVERSMGNKPPITTSASAISSVATAQEPLPTLTAAEKAEKMARWKAQRKRV